MQDGVRWTIEFYLVPKANFADKRPPWLQEFLLTEEELRRNYKVSPHTELSVVFVVDQACELKRLGKRVGRLAFEQSFSHRLSVQGAGSVAPPSDEEPDETPAAASATATPGAALVPGIALASSGGAGPRSALEDGVAPPVSAGAAPEVVTGPPSKRQRVLKMLQSEEKEPVEEREAGNLEELMHRIKKAAKAKLLWAVDATNSATVHFWCGQAIAALRVLDLTLPLPLAQCRLLGD